MFFLSKHSRLIAALLVTFILAGCGGAEERKAKYLERGKSYFEEQNYEKAGVEFKNVLQIDPKTAAPYYYLGRIAEQGQDWRKAFGFYNKAVELGPELLDARIRLGRFDLLAGEIDKAEEQANEVLSREADNPGALTLRASIRFRQDKVDEAITLLQGVLDKAPGEENAATLLSSIYARQDKDEESLKVLTDANAANPDSLMVKVALVQTYLRRKENDKAEAVMTGLVDKYPDELNYRVTLASFYSQTNQNDKAEAVLRKAIADDPEDAQRHLLLVEFFKTKQGLDKAIAELESDAGANPDMAELQFALARLYAEAGQADKVEAVYRALIDKYGTEPHGLEARTAIAAMRANAGKSEEAKSLLEQVLKENPQDSGALMLKGRMQLQEKQYTDAIVTFRSILKDQPDSADVMVLLAAAHQANGEKELALENLSRAVQAQPANINARISLARFQASSGNLDDALENVNAALAVEPANVKALRAKAEILAHQGAIEALEGVLTQIEQASPETGLGAFGKGRLYKSQKKYPEAIAAFEEALKREPDSIMALTELTNVEVISGDFDGAIKRLKATLQSDPDHRAAHFLLGSAFFAKQDYASAEQEFTRQLDVNNKSSMVYRQIAASRINQGNKVGAMQTLEQGLQAVPGDPELMLNLAALKYDLGDIEGAIGIYKQGMETAPENERFPLGLAGIYEHQNKYEDAISVYEKLLEKSPDNLVAVNNLAVLLSEHRTDEQSKSRALELALRLADSDQPALRDTLGWIYYLAGDYDKAADILSGVVEKAPEVGVFRYHLGMTYYKQGDFRAARDILSKAVAEDKHYDGVETARRVYAEIRDK